MRLFLLPISTKRALIYCEKSSKLPTDRKTLLDKATTKAAQIWLQWEKSNKKWQKTVTEYGNKAFQRIPFEEWGLKSIPPLSPRRRAEGASGKKVESTDHKRTALSGSKHLEFLLDNNLIKPSPSPTLDELYSAGISHKSKQWQRAHTDLVAESPPRHSDDSGGGASRPGQQKESVLLQQWNSRLIAQALEVSELHPELERAIRQVEKSLKAEAMINDGGRKSDDTQTKEEKKKAER
ncbi:hypothetical protein FGG08_004311 [Glutinoglossum americanum]|uniref:Uncharacterized protein n=1 Tax=Glutinoglossum americanum TaxID=1670608 RepID=A0A9P8I9G3_9PEZI|nr:hypothetical protein FGG08_004311 [Glutinoglossum americanum]